MTKDAEIKKIAEIISRFTMLDDQRKYGLAHALYNAGYRKVPELTLIGKDEKLACSLISKYLYKEIKDVIDEACIHQLDHTEEQIEKE